MKAQFITEIKKALRDIIPERRLSNLSEETRFRDLGIDSVAITQFVAHLEDIFQISFSDDDLMPENFQDISSLIRLLEEKRGEEQ